MVMQALGMLSADQASQAIADIPQITAAPAASHADIAPAFISLALTQLDMEFGPGRVDAGGLECLTTLDYNLQLQAVCTVQNQVARLAGNANGIPASDGSTCEAANLLPALQPGKSLPSAEGSVVILDPQTGQILAAVGDTGSDGQRTSLATEPAGTVITPFIYLTGFSARPQPGFAGLGHPQRCLTVRPGLSRSSALAHRPCQRLPHPSTKRFDTNGCRKRPEYCLILRFGFPIRIAG